MKTIKGFAESENLSPFLAAVLLLLGELALEMESKFHTYFQILPKDPPPSLITWTDEERSLLKGVCSFVRRHSGIARQVPAWRRIQTELTLKKRFITNCFRLC